MADPTAHAEILALREAAAELGSWRLGECAMAVTLEPCPMCAGAIVNARLGRLVYGCDDPKAGAIRTLYKICDDPRLNHQVEITAGVLAEECAGLLRDFFRRSGRLERNEGNDDGRASKTDYREAAKDAKQILPISPSRSSRLRG